MDPSIDILLIKKICHDGVGRLLVTGGAKLLKARTSRWTSRRRIGERESRGKMAEGGQCSLG